MEHNINDFTNYTDIQVFEHTKATLERKYYIADGLIHKFSKYTINKKKESILRLRCDFSNDGCTAAISLTRQGCIDWLCNFQHTQGNAKWLIFHDLSRHNDEKPFIPVTEGFEPILNKELDTLIRKENLTRAKILERLGNRVPMVLREEMRQKIKRRMEIWVAKVTKENCLLNSTKIRLNRFDHDYCRAEIKFVSEGRAHRALIFASRPQLRLLESTRVIAIDGFFKLKVKGFKQLFTFMVFLNSVYIPVAHMLLTDKTPLG